MLRASSQSVPYFTTSQILYKDLKESWIRRNEFVNWEPYSIITGTSEAIWEKSFPVKGQGVVIFTTSRQRPFALCVQGSIKENWISLEIHDSLVVFFIKKGHRIRPLTMVTGENCGIDKNSSTSYWFSYDRDQLMLKYGKGYRMEETTIMIYDFLKDAKLAKEKANIRQQLYPFFNAEHHIVAKQFDEAPEFLKGTLLKSVYDAKATENTGNRNRYTESVYDVEPDVEFDRNPFVCNIPPVVLDSSHVTLDLLDKGEYCFSASLPAACKELYENTKNCELIDIAKTIQSEEENSILLDAIRYSIKTDGCSLHKKLKRKAEIFGKDPLTTYLRVTIGKSFGNSPGIPYVLEIWPSNHRSPIHNHGNAHAAVKVLFGSIRIQIYNKHTRNTEEKPLKEFDARAGDVTWISRNWYQTHRLVNITGDFCATIQCYKYDDHETTHWPYFDYVSDESAIKRFLPDSDFCFRDMCRTVLEDYAARVKSS